MNYFSKHEEDYKTISEEVMHEYRNLLIKLNWYGFLQRNHGEKKIIQKITNFYGTNIQIIIGDWSQANNMKHMISTPNKRLLNLLHKNFPTYLIDEFNSSKKFYKNQEILKNSYCKFNHNQNIKKIHAILYGNVITKQGKNCINFINRDRNACKNFQLIFNYFINNNGDRHPEYRRNNIPKGNYCIAVKSVTAEKQNHTSVKDSDASAQMSEGMKYIIINIFYIYFFIIFNYYYIFFLQYII